MIAVIAITFDYQEVYTCLLPSRVASKKGPTYRPYYAYPYV